MDQKTLGEILHQAHRQRKYVWLKQTFDPRPLYGVFDYDEPLQLHISIFDCTQSKGVGCRALDIKHVEWAHVSDQTYFTDMQNVLEDITDESYPDEIKSAQAAADSIYERMKLAREHIFAA